MEANHHKNGRPVVKIIIRVILSVIIVSLGFAGMRVLAGMKKPPAEVKRAERALLVTTKAVMPEDVEVVITGFGEAQARDVVMISPEVTGRIVDIHPRLEVGEVIAEGELLFQIDPRDYEVTLAQTQATVTQLQTAINLLEKEYEIDRQRLKTLQRTRELAKAEFQRVRQLYDKDKVGTRSGVDAAEQAYNQAVDQADQLARAVALYPLRIRETRSNLAAAIASRDLAQINLARCRVTAPYLSRIKAVSVERNQYVRPGEPALTLADDRTLEIQVALDSRDARRWLRFTENNDLAQTAWFSGLKPVTSHIRWTEDPEGHVWSGQLQRVVAFDPQTRTLTVAVQIEAQQARNEASQALPLVEGMFCAVEIPGRTLHQVFQVPRWAVSFENTTYIARESRLKTVPVKIARIQGDKAYVSQGLAPGDEVITTRLIDPLENTLLEITDSTGVEERS